MTEVTKTTILKIINGDIPRGTENNYIAWVLNLHEWINGTTELTVNGEKENVPNVYFKFEYTNENGNLERGYLLNLKPNKEGKSKMHLSNENIIV